MTMFMYNKVIAITNRQLCEGDFLDKIRSIAEKKPAAILLREKDLPAEEYQRLAKQVYAICQAEQVKCILHTHRSVAEYLHCPYLHLPLPLFREAGKTNNLFIGVSIHSVAEAREAEQRGAAYLIAGHIYETDCKKGQPPRGIGFLKEICESVEIPVYAIGGINEENLDSVIEAGAAGGCIMSGFMQNTAFK